MTTDQSDGASYDDLVGVIILQVGDPRSIESKSLCRLYSQTRFQSTLGIENESEE